jgi:hypothetical protein
MEEKTEIKAVELVRSIRDRQAELLAGKSNEEIIAFFRIAGDKARRAPSPSPHARSKANDRLQAD